MKNFLNPCNYLFNIREDLKKARELINTSKDNQNSKSIERLDKLIPKVKNKLRLYNRSQKNLFSRIFDKEIYDDKKVVFKTQNKNELTKSDNSSSFVQKIFYSFRSLSCCRKKKEKEV